MLLMLKMKMQDELADADSLFEDSANRSGISSGVNDCEDEDVNDSHRFEVWIAI
jgi:hypothetical protein